MHFSNDGWLQGLHHGSQQARRAKQRRIERLPSGYVIREFSDDSRGQFWYVVTAF
jgi:hypothetical protein